MSNDGKELQRVSWEIRLFGDLQLHNSFKIIPIKTEVISTLYKNHVLPVHFHKTFIYQVYSRSNL